MAQTTFSGIYHASGKGYGFITPDQGGQDYFVPPKAQGTAWDGDRVTAYIEGMDGSGNRATAMVGQILQRNNKEVVGRLSGEKSTLWLTPDSQRLPPAIALVGGVQGAKLGEKVAVEVASYGKGTMPPTGKITARFGQDGTRETAVEAILYQNHIAREFPTAVTQQVAKISQQVGAEDCAGRLDLRGETIITIDGATAKDLDDAVSLTQRENGDFVLGVHIADVSHYVAKGTPLDEEAWHRGTSVYYADGVIPMLPTALSNGICSLHPQVDRLTISCQMTMDINGALQSYEIKKSVIHTAERMTYSDCNQLLDGADGPLHQRYAHIVGMLRNMAVLAERLKARRQRRGSLDLESSECYIHCDESGKPVSIERREQGRAEGLIESFMLAANECVAEHLAKQKVGAVYRIHEAPATEKVQQLRTTLAPFDYPLPVNLDGFALQKILDRAKERPEKELVNMLVLRALQKARYDQDNLGHFGLASEFYCHFTSPIRRYPDLMVHRTLTALLCGAGQQVTSGRYLREVEEGALQSTVREQAAVNAQREIEKIYLAEYMHHHLGEEFPGLVTGVTRFGLFVQLPFGVEGLVPLSALPDDYYHYDGEKMALIGTKQGGVFSFGMALQVVCVSANVASGQIDFQLKGVTPRPSPAGQSRDSAPKKKPSPWGGKKGNTIPAPRKKRRKKR